MKKGLIAKSSENFISVKKGCTIFLDGYRFFDACSDKLSITLKFFRSLYENEMEEDLFKRKLACPNEKGQSIESFYKPLKLGREDYFSTLKQSYPGFKEIIRKQAFNIGKNISNIK